ncbi:MAG: Arc family DNA-binding protein [Armatimonadia bacterium]
MSRDDPQFKLRLPIELRDRIEQAAKESKRSLNAEMVARLEMSFAQEQGMEAFSGKLDKASVELLRRTSEVFKRLLDEADKEAGKK